MCLLHVLPTVHDPLRHLARAALAFLVLASLGAAAAPPFTLQGTVRDRTFRSPVAGATLTLVASRRSAETDDDGTFSFGTYAVSTSDQLVISHPEYRTVTLPLGSLGTEAWHLDITIVREALEVSNSAPDSR